jgi:hypothetical protein
MRDVLLSILHKNVAAQPNPAAAVPTHDTTERGRSGRDCGGKTDEDAGGFLRVLSFSSFHDHG